MMDAINSLLKGHTIPTLYISQRVVQKMAQAAQEYLEDETGEAMVGLITKDRANDSAAVYILDTIAPGEGAIREEHTFQQGGAWQDDVTHWLRTNWQAARERQASNNAKFDAPLYHLGDWHKQPGYMIQPSGGDLATALEWIYQPNNRIGFLVAPILTIDHPATVTDPEEISNFIRVEQPNQLMTRIDFWYIARGMVGFRPIVPNVVKEDSLPRLMDYPWHLVSKTRAAQEVRLLEQDGMMVELLIWDTDEQLPLEVCFLTARAGASHLLLVATPANYPFAAPAIYKLPFVPIQPDEDLYDLLRRVWSRAERVADLPSWKWSVEKTLLEYVYMAEETLGLRDNPLKSSQPPTEGTGSAE